MLLVEQQLVELLYWRFQCAYKYARSLNFVEHKMVRLAYAAINAVGEGEEEQQGVETLEAQEARVANTYMRALQLVQEERKEEAKVCSDSACVAESHIAIATAPLVPFICCNTLTWFNKFTRNSDGLKSGCAASASAVLANLIA